jgi:hypothetical protein
MSESKKSSRRSFLARSSVAAAGAALAGNLSIARSARAALASATELFVARGGDDTQTGTRDQPFATIHRAQQAARAARKARPGMWKTRVADPNQEEGSDWPFEQLWGKFDFSRAGVYGDPHWIALAAATQYPEPYVVP